MLRWLGILWLVLFLSACVTTSPPAPNPQDPIVTGPVYPDPDVENPGVIIIAEPVLTPPPAPEIPAPPPPQPKPPEIEIFETARWFSGIEDWAISDHRPALASFRRSCQSWAKADSTAMLNPNQPEYGRFSDWLPACNKAAFIGGSKNDARHFFESEFEPISLSTKKSDSGLLTGYYEPEINVRKIPDAIYSEPVLAAPKSKAIQNLPRAELGPRSSRVIAYGTPIDVFFMQIQGSGRIKFKDGKILRAAYDGNNGKPYVSIGKILVARGEMSLKNASKQAIDDWMVRAGPIKARALINENPRYIFFTEQAIAPGEGPRGGMRVPLTDMGSMAVDTRYHPYGTLAWLSTILPQKGGDFKGKPQGILVSVQDTGNAIRGPLRGDLFFGSGKIAGDKAGVMKHPVRWTILVPKAIAPKSTATS